MNKYISVTAFLILLFITGNTLAQDIKVRQIDSLIDKAYDLGVFNGNLLVSEQDNVIYKASMGFAEGASKNRLNDQYRFNIGDIGNEFSSVGIMMLVEQGKLKLDEKISKYITNLPSWGGKVSIKNLLQYNSGLPDIKWKSVQNDEDNFNDLKKTTTLDFEPGTKYDYNGNAVFLQRRVIEKITGISFNKFVEEKIFKPCEMVNSIMDPMSKELLIARSYNNEHTGDVMAYPISGSAFLTVDDLLKWSESLQKFLLVKPASITQLLMPFEKDKQAGLGKVTLQGEKMITHTHNGTNRNYQTLLTANTSKGRTVILMSNNKNINLYDLNIAIQAILDGKPFLMPKKSIFQKIERQLNILNGQQIIAFYEYLKIHNTQDYNFDNEYELNSIGYFLLGKGRFEDALTVFGHNANLYPKSSKIFDGIGDTYYKKGERKAALINYKKSLQLDPSNKIAKERIAELEKPIIEKK